MSNKILPLVILVTLVVACNSAAKSTECPVPGADSQLLLEQELGYCLLYPADYTTEQISEGDISLVKGSIMNHTDPRVSINVSEAGSQTTAEAADQIWADYVPPGFDSQRETLTLDGEEAILLDNLPGQDITRMVVIVHNDQRYWLTFAPIGESLFELVTDSFHFTE